MLYLFRLYIANLDGGADFKIFFLLLEDVSL